MVLRISYDLYTLMKRFYLLTTLLLLSRSLDAATTYLYTPTLQHELNPIASVLGGGWMALIVLQVILLSAIIYGLWVYFKRPVDVPGVSAKTSLREFISLYNFRKPGPVWKAFYTWPTNPNAFAASMGYSLTLTLIAISFIVGTSTTFLLLSPAYEDVYRTLGLPYVLLGLAVGLAAYFTFSFYRRELQKRKATIH